MAQARMGALMFTADERRERLAAVARTFLDALRSQRFDQLWQSLITDESRTVLSAALIPISMANQGSSELLFHPVLGGSGATLGSALSLAFHMDAQGMRAGFLQGMADGLRATGWYDFPVNGSLAFSQGTAAVLIADASPVKLIVPFSEMESGDFKVDLLAMSLFSMYLNAHVLYQIGLSALQHDRPDIALSFFELTTSLAAPYTRIQRLISGHPIVGQFVADARRDELAAEQNYVVLARDQTLRLLSSPTVVPRITNMYRFMAETFNHYAETESVELAPDDIRCLNMMTDADLRQAIAAILHGVDPSVAQRESRKPHSAAEIADMEVPVTIDGSLYYLCMPFKTGVEIRTERVPVDVAYQIVRPFMVLSPNCVVVFVTAKPCSQPLLNYIKTARATQGWPIEVLEHAALAKLLKLNGLLPTP